MEPRFTVFAHVGRPPAEVYEAIVDPAQLSRYFTTGGAQGRIESGATLTWDFHDFPGAFPVEVVEADGGARIVLRWDANEEGLDAGDGYRTNVTFALEPVDDGSRTRVSITEEGWRETDSGLQASYGNCMGWSQMLCALKAWLEHGLNLRDGMYR
jgi:uncharacterized protein YndB with AHSA1/START domain